MLKPGPDHPITLEPARNRWRAFYAGHVIADSNDALILQEADYKPVVYFPRQDVAMDFFSRQDGKTTHCPYKGDASYYTLFIDGEFAEGVAWSYEAPFDAMQPIAGRIAFYPDRVEVYEVDDAAVNPRAHDRREDVDQVVQHTDAGDGRSQREHWAPNVETLRPDDGGVR